MDKKAKRKVYVDKNGKRSYICGFRCPEELYKKINEEAVKEDLSFKRVIVKHLKYIYGI